MPNEMQPQGLDLNNPNQSKNRNGPVECLGQTFENDQARRKHYLALLAEKLKDPEFRKIEGFPIGEDEDILELSDPPYYTACPNPFIGDFIAHYGRPYDPSEGYKREPYAADVSEGKNHSIYLAHSYHTKVPHKAVMRYILHYTSPGDVVLDGFCGTGMTGVAATLCGDQSAVEELGYRVLSNGEVQDYIPNGSGKEGGKWVAFSQLGKRKVILNDLSPAATFIANNFNAHTSPECFKSDVEQAIKKVNDKYGWVYSTFHNSSDVNITDAIKAHKGDSGVDLTNFGELGKINYVLWSDVFACPQCGEEMVFWDSAVDQESYSVAEKFNCPSCHSVVEKNRLERVWESNFDSNLDSAVQLAKQVPAIISYTFNGKKFVKKPDDFDGYLFSAVADQLRDSWVPTTRLMEGKEARRNDAVGITHVHQFYTSRALLFISEFKKQIKFLSNAANLTSITQVASKLYRFRSQGGSLGAGGGPMSGTLYVPSLIKEIPVSKLLKEHADKTFNMRVLVGRNNTAFISTGSASKITIPDASVDYLFFDPPFGANLMYSELNFIWESWLKVFTEITPEAIENSAHSKSVSDYRQLMGVCFKEAYRVLKPGRWITVEFSNSKAAVWNSIQRALVDAGFLIANVSALDKKQGSFKSVTTPTAVKQDLVISAYKPNGGFEQRFVGESNESGVWDFVRTHLSYLPAVKKQKGILTNVPERDPRILYDQVISYFVRCMRDVPLSSKEFQDGLLERFAERDGMFFLPEQVAEYDKARLTSGELKQLSIFVNDEATAIEWLRQLLTQRPQSYQNMHPKFIQELSGWKKAEELLELNQLLDQNFLKYDGQGPLPPQIHAYLSTNYKDLRGLAKNDPLLVKKAKGRWYVPNPEREEDLQKLRERNLIKIFDEYILHDAKQLKTVRLEAVRCGFRKAFQDRNFKTIIQVADKIPQNLIMEDRQLLMWYDQAQTRLSDESLF